MLGIAEKHSLSDTDLDDFVCWRQLAICATTEAQDATEVLEMLLSRSKTIALDPLAAFRVAPRPEVATFMNIDLPGVMADTVYRNNCNIKVLVSVLKAKKHTYVEKLRASVQILVHEQLLHQITICTFKKLESRYLSHIT